MSWASCRLTVPAGPCEFHRVKLPLAAGIALSVAALAGPAGQSGTSTQLPKNLESITLGPDPNGQPFALHFSRPVPIERCSIYTYQTGDFGGLSMPSMPPFGAGMGTVYTIRTGSNGRPARTLKAAVWCPGFASQAIEVADLVGARPEASVPLTPLRSVMITGSILPSEDGVSLAGAELVVWYQALWVSALFGQTDGFTPQWEVARTRIATDSSFRLEVPDFMNDPTIARFRWPGSFSFGSNRSTPPHNYRLEADSRGGDLPVAAKYAPVRLQPRR